jgi:hypothetical protein
MTATRAQLLIAAGRETETRPVLDALQLRGASEYVRPFGTRLIEASLGHEDMPLLFLETDPQFDVLKKANTWRDLDPAAAKGR